MVDATWLDVVDWEGLYMVSDMGDVKSLSRRVGQSRWPGSTGRTLRERTLKPGTDGRGYKSVRLCRDGKGYMRKVHVLVLTAHVGPRPPGMEGCHGPAGNGVNRLDNLRWDTPSENALDVIRHGNNPQVKKTTCPRNHPLVGANLMPSCLAKGQRTCLACNRALSKLGHRKRAGHAITPELIQAEADNYYWEIIG